LCALSFAITLSASGCERSAAQARPVASGNAGRPPAAAAVAALDGGAKPAALDPDAWVEAFRLGRWAEAARALDARPDLERRPGLRFARARAAAELGDPARVLALATGLERELPDLEPRISRLRADAQLLVGPYAAAADFFTARGDVESLARAALARERGGELAKASALAGQVVAELTGTRRRWV
jgi:hypothetical protein